MTEPLAPHEQALLLAAAHQTHGDSTGFNAWDLVHAYGSCVDALAYWGLFWPEFFRLDDMILLRPMVETDAELASARELRRTMTAAQVERRYNFLDVQELFGARSGESSLELDEVLARKLAAVWRVAVAHQFPGRAFDIAVEDNGNGGLTLVTAAQSAG